MVTIEDIEKWMKRAGLKRKEAAKRLGVSYTHFIAVLSGARPLTAKLAAAVVAQCDAPESGLIVRVPDEMEPLLKLWAETAGKTVEQLVHDLLAESLRIPKKSRE